MIRKLYDLTPLCTLIRMFPTVDFVISELNDGSLVASILTDDTEITYHPLEMKGDEPSEYFS